MSVRAFVALVLLFVVDAATAPAEIRFRDAGASWGLDGVRHRNGAAGAYLMPETMGAGLAAFDFDDDGDLDLLFVDGAPLPGYDGPAPRTRLFRNDRAVAGPRFVDVTQPSGIAVSTYGMGAAAGDVDADSDLDLLVTGWGGNQLFENRGDGTFVDATTRSGVGVAGWATSAAFADVEGDADLDLYVAEYVATDLEHNPPCGVREHGVRSYCHPDAFDPLSDRFFRGRGDGTFVDATAAAGFAETTGKGMGVVFADLDGDHRPDVYVANDMTPNFHFHNLGMQDGAAEFEEIGLLSNTALSDRGAAEAGMGIALGDTDGDRRPDLFVTNFDFETNALYGNLGNNLFVDRRYVSRLAEPSLFLVGFGTAFADLDHDADLDLVVANGHIIDNIERWSDESTYRQRNQVFENDGEGRFRELPEAGLTAVRSSRGLATGDLDGDLDLDVVITNSNDLAEVWENATPPHGALLLDLRMPSGEAHGIGARVTVDAGARRRVEEVRTGGSYLSQSALTLHFGLAGASKVDAFLELRGGQRLRLRGLPANRRVRVDVPPPRSGAGTRPAPTADG